MKEKTKDRIYLSVSAVTILGFLMWFVGSILEIRVNQEVVSATLTKLEKSTQETLVRSISLNIAVRETRESVRALWEEIKEERAARVKAEAQAQAFREETRAGINKIQDKQEATNASVSALQEKQEATNASVSALQEQQKVTDDTVQTLLKN